MQVVLLAGVGEVPSLALSQELLRPRKLARLKQILDEGTAMLYPTFAPAARLPAEEGGRLARMLISSESLHCLSTLC